MKAKELMTRAVISVDADAQVAAAIGLMLKYRVSGLPVVDENRRLVGIITEGDLLRRAEIDAERPAAWWKELLFGKNYAGREHAPSHPLRVASLMTPKVHCVGPEASLETVVGVMATFPRLQ